MNDRFGECSVCKKHTYIQNKKNQMCRECVYKKNHGGKSRSEVALERRKKSQSKVTRKRSNYTYKRKSTGERELFIEIWMERDHICNNCKAYLGNEPKVHFFSHIKSKGSRPDLRLSKSNIQLLCYDCHYALDHRGDVAFKERTR